MALVYLFCLADVAGHFSRQIDVPLRCAQRNMSRLAASHIGTNAHNPPKPNPPPTSSGHSWTRCIWRCSRRRPPSCAPRIASASRSSTGFLGQWIHKQIGKSMKNESQNANTSSDNSIPANSETAKVEAHDKGVSGAIVLGAISFFILICVCRTTVGDGFFSDQESSINWAGVVMGTFICACIGYWLAKPEPK